LFSDHINYVRDLIGADHVGIGGDYDGVNSVPKGLEDVSKYPDLFDKLAEEGHGYEPWTKDELKKLAGLNLIRVWKEVEKIRDNLKNAQILDDPIPYEDIINENPNAATCRTDIDNNSYMLDFQAGDEPRREMMITNEGKNSNTNNCEM
jgi:membrane dipeptidase